MGMLQITKLILVLKKGCARRSAVTHIYIICQNIKTAKWCWTPGKKSCKRDMTMPAVKSLMTVGYGAVPPPTGMEFGSGNVQAWNARPTWTLVVWMEPCAHDRSCPQTWKVSLSLKRMFALAFGQGRLYARAYRSLSLGPLTNQEPRRASCDMSFIFNTTNLSLVWPVMSDLITIWVPFKRLRWRDP